MWLMLGAFFAVQIPPEKPKTSVPCGAEALAMCVSELGGDLSAQDIAFRLPRRGKDASLLELKMEAESLGYYCWGVRWKESPSSECPPAIVPVTLPRGEAHYVAVLKWKDDELLVAEYGTRQWITKEKLLAAGWDGTALHLSRNWTDRYMHIPLNQFVTTMLFGAFFLIVAVFWRRRSMLSKSHTRASDIVAVRDSGSTRSGVTMVEILVSCSVITLLISLLLPAVQSTRESARRIWCSNNLRQFGVAMHGFESSYKRFPLELSTELQSVSGLEFPYQVSAHFCLLPYLEHSTVQARVVLKGDVWDLSSDPPLSQHNAEIIKTAIPVFLCPSDHGKPGTTNYLMCHGTSPHGGTTPDAPVPNSARDGFGRRAKGVPASDVTDGLSNTIAFSERLIGGETPDRYVPSRDIAYLPGMIFPPLPDETIVLCRTNVSPTSSHSSFSGHGWIFHSLGVTTYNQILPPNSTIPDCSGGSGGGAGLYSARSLHLGGCQTLLGDGSVKFVSQSIDQNVWRALGTIDSSDVAQIP